MIKRRGKSQIGNLTPDHKSLEIKGQMKFNLDVLHTVKKIIFKALRYYPHVFKKNLNLKKNECLKFWDNKSPSFETPT